MTIGYKSIGPTIPISPDEKRDDTATFLEYIRLVKEAKRAADEAQLFAWRNFDNDAFERLTTNGTSPYSLSFMASELGAIEERLEEIVKEEADKT